MNHLNDISLIISHAEAQSEEVKAAIHRRLLAPPHDPPGRLGAALGCAVGLANQIMETGLDSGFDQEPAEDAVAILLFRLTRAVESLGEAVEHRPALSAAASLSERRLRALADVYDLLSYPDQTKQDIIDKLREWAMEDQDMEQAFVNVDAEWARQE